MSEDPEWLNDDENLNHESSFDGNTTKEFDDLPPDDNTSKPNTLMKKIFSFLTIFTMFFTFIVCFIGFKDADSVGDTGSIFISLYLIMFSSLLIIHELKICFNLNRLEYFFKQNFGFLYGVYGRGFFMIFIGILCCGISTSNGVSVACGVITCMWGAAYSFLYYKFPEYFN